MMAKTLYTPWLFVWNRILNSICYSSVKHAHMNGRIKCMISDFISLNFCMYLSSGQFKMYVLPERGEVTRKSVRKCTREKGFLKDVCTLKYFTHAEYLKSAVLYRLHVCHVGKYYTQGPFDYYKKLC